MGWGTILALILSIIVLIVLFKLIKKVMPIVLNGIFGLVVFWLLDFFGVMHVPLDIWTFLIAAIGGIFGVIIVLVLSFLGVPL